MIWRNFKMAIKSLSHAKTRSFLTMLGLIIGIGSVVAVLAIGHGVRSAVVQQITDLGSNIIIITTGNVEGENGQGLNPAASFGATTLTDQDVNDVRETPGILQVAPLALISGVIRSGENTAPGSFVIATAPEYISLVKNHEVTEGRFLEPGDHNEFVAVVTPQVAQKLFPDQTILDQRLVIRDEEFTVIGMVESTSETSIGFGDEFDNMVFLSLGAGEVITEGNPQIIRMLAEASSTETIDQTVAQLEERLRENHGGQKDFSVLTQEDVINSFEQILNILTAFIAAIAAISLLVGGVGIMNIMLVSVTERTKEIGIRKAIGANNRHILSQFLIEAVVLSLFGGLLGVGFAYLLGLIVKARLDINPVITLEAIGLAVGVSTLIGIIFGIAPAIKAARKHPIQALRYE